MSAHANISVFVPHIGCKKRCSFCDQHSITGVCTVPNGDTVRSAVETAVRSGNCDPKQTEIAFFGGSFTAIERGYMTELLRAARPYVENKTVRGIRISTRPDAIDEEILEILADCGVCAIELGAQSMDDGVLAANHRGHTAADVEEASRLIRQKGFELGLQMMTGLYGDSDEKCIETARQFVRLQPDTVRIYPTVVLKNTALAEYYRQGKYVPQTLDEAVSLANRLLDIFDCAGIRVIRLGLHTVSEDSYLAGPFHPAFGELCESARYYDKLNRLLEKPGNYTVYVAPGEISKVIGQKRKNMEALRQRGFVCRVCADQELKKGMLRTERTESECC